MGGGGSRGRASVLCKRRFLRSRTSVYVGSQQATVGRDLYTIHLQSFAGT